jgi:RHS repeat-associated protein
MLNGSWTASFYGYDGGGNVRQLTGASGAVTDTYEYDAFGNSFTVSGTTPNNYLYRGEQYDSDLGLYYLRARYYNPATGRFMSRDPGLGDDDDDDDDDGSGFTDDDGNDLSIPATLHKYLYTGGDPVNWVDPSGRADIVDTGELTKLIALTLATGAVIYNYELHRNETQAAIQELGGAIECSYDSSASHLSALFDYAVNGGGEVVQVGGCSWTFYKPHRGGNNKGKHQEGQRRMKGSRGRGTHPKYPPRKPPKGWKGPWKPGKTGWDDE